MTTDIATLGLRVDSTQAATASQNLDKLTESGGRAERQVTALESAHAKMAAQVNQMLAPLRQLQALLASVGLALGVHQLIQYADTWKVLEGRLRLVTSSMQDLRGVQEKLFDLAQRTRQSYEATVDLYARMARSSKTLGVTQEQLISVTESVNKAMVISGATAQEAATAIIQLGQGLASGALRGDELRSILEQAPRLAEAIAVGMGRTVGELRRLGEEGKLTSQAIIDALLSQKDVIDREFSQLPVTVGQAFTTLNNAVLKFVGTTDSAFGGTKLLAGGIQLLAANLPEVADGFLALGYAVGTVYVANALTPAIKRVGDFVSAERQLREAVKEGNASYAVGAAGMRARATAALEVALAEREQAAATLARLQVDRAAISASLARAQAERVQAIAQFELASGIKEATGRTAMYEKALQLRNDSTRTVLALTRLERDLIAQTSVAQDTLAAATARAGAAGVAHAAVLRATTIAARATTLAMRGLQAVMAFFGGPIGIAITAAAAAVYLLATRTTEAEKAAEAHAAAMKTFDDAVDRTTAKVKTMNAALAETAQLQVTEAIRKTAQTAAKQREDFIRATGRMDAFMPEGYEGALPGLFELRNAFKAGYLTVTQFVEAMSRLGNEDRQFYDLAIAIQTLAKPLLDTTANLEKEEAALAVLNGTANDAQRALLGLGQGIGKAGKDAGNALSDFEKLEQQLKQTLATVGLSGADAMKVKLGLELDEKTGKAKFTADEIDKLVAIQRKIDAKEVSLWAKEIGAAAGETDRLAEAYSRGGAAIADAELHQRIELEVLRKGEEHRKAITDALTAEDEARSNLDIKKFVAEQNAEIVAAERLVQAHKAGGAAVHEANLKNQIALALARLNIEAGSKEAETIEKLIRRHNELRTEIENMQAIQRKNEELELLQEELRLVDETTEARTIALAVLQTQNDLKRRGIDLTSEQARQEIELTRKIAATKAELEDIRQQREMFLEPLKNAIRGIQDAFTDAFEDIYSGGVRSFSDLGQTIKRIFIRLAAEITSLLVFRPLVGNVLGSVGLGDVAKQMGMGGEAGATGGGFSWSNLMSLGSTGKWLHGIGTSIATSSFGQTIGMSGFDSATRGFANLFAGTPAAGTVAPSMTTFGSSFANGLSASPWGIVGSLGANLLGYGQQNPTNAAIGGTLGSVGGAWAGAAATGAMSGTAAGAMMGSWAGPVGAIIGAFLGTILGDSIGGGVSNFSAGGTMNLATGKAFALGSDGDQNIPARDQLLGSIAQVAQALEATTGGKLGRSMVGVDVGSRDGTQYWFERGGPILKAADPQAALAAITAELASSLEGVTDELKGVISKLDWSDFESASVKLGIAANYRTLFDEKETVGPYAQAIETLNNEYEAALKIVQELELEEAALTATRDRAAARMKKEIDDANAAAIRAAEGRSYINEVINQQQAMEAAYKETAAAGGDMELMLSRNHIELREFFRTLSASQLDDVADYFGGSIAELALAMKDVNAETVALAEAEEMRLQATRDQIEETERSASTWRNLSASLKNYRLGLLVGNMSPLLPEQRLAEARKQFDDVSRRAQIGDIGAMESLEQVSQALLEASRAYYDTGAGYVEDFNRVQAVLANSESVAERHARIADEQLLVLRQQLAEAEHQSSLLSQLGGTSSAPSAAPGVSGGARVPSTPVATHDVSTDAGKITFLYRVGLGREPDSAGLDYWAQQAAAGTPWETLKRDFFYAAEANHEKSIHRFSTGGSFEVRGRSRDNIVPLNARFDDGEVVNVSRRDTMAEVVRLLGELVNNGKKQLGVTAATGGETVDRLESVAKALEETAGRQALVAARAR